jgi:predicted RNase H-like HicB family nuclease
LDLPGCTSAGDTFEEAVVGAYEALAMHVRLMVRDGDKIPKPSARADVERIESADNDAGEELTFAPIVLDRLAFRG